MSKLIKHRLRSIGTSPGVLVPSAEAKTEKVRFSIIDYDPEHLTENPDATPEECLIFLDSPAVTWIHITGIQDPKTLEKIGLHFKLHPLLLEDIMSRSERSKLEDYKENIFLVLRMLNFNGETKEEVEDEQVSIIIGKRYVISFLEKDRDVFNPVRERIRHGNNRIRKLGPDYLTYALVDAIVDNYFVILEKVDEKLEDLEEELVKSPVPKTLHKIQIAKKEMTTLRKSVWPLREVISHFRRLETDLIDPGTNLFMHDVYDHTIQAIDTIEGFRDIVGGMLDIYLSNISLRLNEVMKVLTIVTTTFTPLLFLTSVYGMNFTYMPELHYKWSYPILWLVMIMAASAMLYFFRRKKWI